MTRQGRDDFKVRERRFRFNTRKKLSALRALRHWNRFPKEIVRAPSLEVFQMRLVGALSNLVQCPCPWQGYWNEMVFKVFSNQDHSVILSLFLAQTFPLC